MFFEKKGIRFKAIEVSPKIHEKSLTQDTHAICINVYTSIVSV